MNVHMSFLRGSCEFQAILARDGWAILAAENELDATHPEVANEESARARLYRLGLLLSPSLHIDFFPHAKKVFTDTRKSCDN